MSVESIKKSSEHALPESFFTLQVLLGLHCLLFSSLLDSILFTTKHPVSNRQFSFRVVFMHLTLSNLLRYPYYWSSLKKLTWCVKIKLSNTKIALSQKCMNILVPNFARLFNT